MRSAVAVLAVFTLVVSGCVSSQAGPNAEPTAPAAAPDDETGAIRGLTVDDAHAPIADVQLALLETADHPGATSDAAGQFTINGIPPGEYTLVAQKLGYESAARRVSVQAGMTSDVTMTLAPIPVNDEVFLERLIGQGYLACGAYLVVVTVSNLNICPWDSNHKPRYEFPVNKATAKGVLQEIVWTKNQLLSTDVYLVYLWYKPVCSPTCTPIKSIQETSGKNPVRMYSDISKFKADEDPYTLSSMTFVGPNEGRPAVVYQQKMTHYVTVFHNGPGNPDEYSAIPVD